MIKIYYSGIDNRLHAIRWNGYLSLLPAKEQAKILAFKRWEDAHTSLYGKLLLRKGLLDFGYTGNLEDVKYTDYQRPYMEGCIDYNISHSGSFVVCAFSARGRVGIDIEKIRQIRTEAFKNIWSDQELSTITSAKNPYAQFFSYWTMKEATIKADGKGLFIPLKTILLKENKVELDSGIWYLKKIDFWQGYSCHVATDRLTEVERIEHVRF